MFEDAQAIAALMAANAVSPDLQLVQTEYRLQLVKEWMIPQGAKVLEIGCGQGDMTAVLANAVGKSGHVTAVDIASPDYGTPITVGNSAEHLKNGPLGSLIEFIFECDLLDPAHSFATKSFDYAVLAHCSWYFESLDQLARLLLRIHPWTGRLCFAEWDLTPRSMNQLWHLLSILIQGQIAVNQNNCDGNVRTPFSCDRLKQLLDETGWKVTAETLLDSTDLSDGRWEIDNCLRASETELNDLHISSKQKELLVSQIDTLRDIVAKGENCSLQSYSIIAE